LDSESNRFLIPSKLVVDLAFGNRYGVDTGDQGCLHGSLKCRALYT